MHPFRRGRRLGGGGVEWWKGLPVRSVAHGAHLFGRGGQPAGLPCGSQIPTYLSFGVCPLSARGGTSITMCRPAVWVRGHAGGGRGCRACFRSGPISVGGGGAAKGLLPCFVVPKGNQPTACTLALWWLKFGLTEREGGGVGATDGNEFAHVMEGNRVGVARKITQGAGKKKILLPSARHLEEGRGTAILELLRRENCISRLCPRPLGSHPTPNTQIV